MKGVILMAMLFFSCVSAYTCPNTTLECGSRNVVTNGPRFLEPTVVESVNGTLDMTLSVEIGRVSTAPFSFNARLFCYQGVCSHPGPTIRVRPGDTLRLTLQNNLGSETSGVDLPPNTFRKPNNTNFHTHGLHIDPAVDNVMLDIAPGASHTYDYAIPSDHPYGLQWYHSHRHGAATLQVMGGLVGALDVVPREPLSLPPSLAALSSHTLVFTHIAPACTCQRPSNGFLMWSYQQLRVEARDMSPFNLSLADENVLHDVYLTNGLYQPKLALTAGEWVRFDMVNAAADTFLEVEVRTAIASGTSPCDMRLLALDGVYLFRGPRTVSVVLFAPATRASISVMCPDAGTVFLQSNPTDLRASFDDVSFVQNLLTLEVVAPAVAAPASQAPTWVDGDIARAPYLRDLLSATPAARFEIGFNDTLHTMHAHGDSMGGMHGGMDMGGGGSGGSMNGDGGSMGGGGGMSNSSTSGGGGEMNNMPSPGRRILHTPSPSMGGMGGDANNSSMGSGGMGGMDMDGMDSDGPMQHEHVLGVGTDCRLDAPSMQCQYLPFGLPTSSDPAATLLNFPYRHVGRLCDVEEMVLRGTSGTPHPIHLHVSHMQIVEILDSNGNDVSSVPPFAHWSAIGDWRDTLPALDATMRLRFVLDSFGGNYMVHCHFLPHEDHGMMDRFWVDSQTPRCTANNTQNCNAAMSQGPFSVSAYYNMAPNVVANCAAPTTTTPPPTTTRTETASQAAREVIPSALLWVTVVVTVLVEFCI